MTIKAVVPLSLDPTPKVIPIGQRKLDPVI